MKQRELRMSSKWEQMCYIDLRSRHSIKKLLDEAKPSIQSLELTDNESKFVQKNGHTLYKAPNDLKKVKTETTDATINQGDILEAEKILEHKNIRSGKYKYLVRWLANEPDSWGPQDNLRLVNKNRRSTLEQEYWGSRKS
ncbi:unnamed protein product [Phytophthora lilii]|uniref:Unnamed protein product n=1 Tax=Phytophthora lilii TaxID=2077276 RepID=A0A9W6WXT0_9STRA|nr:unnamed protein product [Phytophthora lilii]